MARLSEKVIKQHVSFDPHLKKSVSVQRIWRPHLRQHFLDDGTVTMFLFLPLKFLCQLIMTYVNKKSINNS